MSKEKTPIEELIEIIHNKYEDDFGNNSYVTGLNTAYRSVIAEIEINKLTTKFREAIEEAYLEGKEDEFSGTILDINTTSEQYYTDKYGE
mgnify:CR=1 FL=1|tara:strand:+ start:21 stop:290 length:270 start_codon:yes stop_codon:yes gene_type:complete